MSRLAALLIAAWAATAVTASPAADPLAARPPAADQPAADPGLDPEAVAFQPLVMDEPATMMALTEDGRFLVVTHRSADLVSVIDAKTREAVVAIDTPSPRDVICRNGGIYVASPEDRSVRFFSAKKGWGLADRFKVDAENIAHLSAPQGEHFDGKILVTCHGPGTQGSYQGATTLLLNTRGKGRPKPAGGHALASYSYDGKLVFSQGSFNLSPSGTIAAFPAAAITLERPEPVMRGDHTATPYLYQTHPGSYWIGGNKVFAGNPIKPIKEDLGDLAVPDLSARLVYALTKFRLTAHRLDTQLTEVGTREASFPKGTVDRFDGISDVRSRNRAYLLDHPVGRTEGDELRLFVLNGSDNSILAATTRAFAAAGPKENRKPAAAPPEGGPPQRGDKSPRTQEERESEEGADEGRADGEADEGGAERGGAEERAENEEDQLGVPQYAAAGRRLRVKLHGPTQARYELVSAPKGVTLSPTGLLQWTPTARQFGTHEITVRIRDGRDVTEAAVTVEVVTEDKLDPEGSP